MDNRLTTHHAPAERFSQESIRVQSSVFKEDANFRVIIEAMPHIVTILNSCRQIIYANRVLMNILGLNNLNDIIGRRPGEALNCIHSRRMPGGCGTSEFCRMCGAVGAILEALDGKEDTRECRITNEAGMAFDFMALAKPLHIEEERYVVFSVTDISAEKRRNALEQIFFHDILNTAGCISGYAHIISDEDFTLPELKKMSSTVKFLSSRLIDEIKSQQLLAAAERGELEVSPIKFCSKEFVEQMVLLYSNHEAASGKTIIIDPSSDYAEIVSDRTLMQRVIGNMIKNALEALEPGEAVRISSRTEDGMIKFSVHSSAFIPRDIQLQIFQRSFSTKSERRGLGTYSMKLLTEQFLQGEIAFTSNANDGTTFTTSYPLILG